MCRLFGFRSVLQSQVHRSLTQADNAMSVQALQHPDGWGVAYYVAGSPHLIKASGPAEDDRIFHHVSGVLTSRTVLAHVRKATQGRRSPLNSHPFQHGRWVMAHNGDVPRFAELRERLVDQVPPRLRRYLLGDTDSEVLFHLFLGLLSEEVELDGRGAPLPAVVRALQRAVAIVRSVADDPDHHSLLTVIVTDGEVMVAHQGGKELHWSTHKLHCPEQGGCPHFGGSCLNAVASGAVNHLIVSSEPLQGENVWNTMAEGEIVGVDHAMRLHRFPACNAPMEMRA